MKAKPKKIKAIWITVFGLLVLMLIAKACQKDKFELPVVHTGEVVEITHDGVIFHGKIIEQGNRKITDHGFVWGLKSNPTFESDYKITMGSIFEQLFKAEISSGLQEGKQYHVRAFAKTENTIIYGRPVSFLSLGSKPPIITQFQPENGIWGDTITLWVENLSQNLEDFELFLGSHKVQLIYYSEDSLQISVPESIADTVFTISIRAFNNEVFASSTFKIDPPEIFDFTPEGGIKDSTIFISGRAFHPNKIRNKVFLGNTELEILTHSKNSFKVKLPGGIEHGEYNIKVNTLGREAISQNLFTYYQPWRRLNNTPFYPHFGLSLQFEDKAFFLGFNNSPEDITLWEYHSENDSWTDKGIVPFIYPSSSFSMQTKGYVLENKLLFQYDPETNQWTQKASWNMPFPWLEGSSSFSTIHDFYICGGQGFNSFYNFLYQYNELTDTWLSRKNFPEQRSYGAIGFSIHEKGYVALGQIGNFIPNLNIYEYDPLINDWKIKTSFQGILQNSHLGRESANVFVIEDKAFIFGGYSIYYDNTQFNDLYKFDPINNTIKRLPDLPTTPYYFACVFSLNGKGYMSLGHSSPQLWEFDPSKLPPWLQ
jgi:hypothetical protein